MIEIPKEAQVSNSYPTKPLVQKGELPDPFALPKGNRISSIEEWPLISCKWREIIVEKEYGGMPPGPGSIEIETLYHSYIHNLLPPPQLNSYRLHCIGGEKNFSFEVKILIPETSQPPPVIINGDSCWWNVSDEVAKLIATQGCALILFNRTALAEDLGYPSVSDPFKQSGGLYDIYPGNTFGAISAWAWGYHRCVDLIFQLPNLDKKHIAVTGHSRGGKTALLAGATDTRIAIINDNASGEGGSSAFRYVGDEGETIRIIEQFPSWFGSGLEDFLDQEDKIPFDQNCFLALIAPRPLLMTYALDDRWSNPEGMVQCFWATKKVYEFLNSSSNIAFHFRKGEHAHSLHDWQVLLDFINWKWQGGTPQSPFNRHPYNHLKPIFSWGIPNNLKENIHGI